MSRQPRKRRHFAAVVVSVAAHLLIPLVLLFPQADAPVRPPRADPEPVAVTLVKPPRREPAPLSPEISGGAPPAKAPPSPVVTPPPVKTRPPQPAPPDVIPIQASPVAAPEPDDRLTGAQLAGARTAGSGSGGRGGGSGRGVGSGSGGDCDMVRWLQDKLRQDPDIQAVVNQAHRSGPSAGRTLLVWNGDWIQRSDQAGKGLAGVRQAIAVEVAFAPQACRADPVRGLIVISMNDGPGAASLALGQGEWRWSDLLAARRGPGRR